MKKISTAELKKAILAVEAERLKHPARFQPDRAQRAALQKGRQASEKMLAGFLTEAGLDLNKFQALHKRRSAELERMVAKHKADAIRRAPRQKDAPYSSIVAQSKALADLAARSDFFPNPTFTLDTPFLIWTIPLQPLFASAAVPFGSWAKFKFSTSQYQGTTSHNRGAQKVGFYFYWANPSQDYAVINAATFMSANGYLSAQAPWTFSPNSSLVAANALLNLWFGWPSGVTSRDFAGQFLGSTGALGQLGTGGDSGGISISSGVSLNTTMFAVPPGDIVVFEVALWIAYENTGDGDIEADFESGNFGIRCPVVVFSLLNAPSDLSGVSGVMA